MSGLSLYTIEQSLAELLEAREDLIEKRATVADGLPPQSADAGDLEADVNAELAEVEKALAEYFTREISKADGVHYAIRAYTDVLAQAEAEKQRITERVDRLKSTLKRIKQAACEAMEVLGKKRIDGTAGRYLMCKANGGVAPLTIQPEVLPNDYRDVVIQMPHNFWFYLVGSLSPEEWPAGVRTKSLEPNNDRIRAALAAGEEVPGARLGERGKHLEIK
jgi:hypothetical protein